MSRRLTLAMPVVLAASVVAISLSATTGDAADECLSGPKGTAPTGSHWYYRVDRSTGRHCWYLGAEGQTDAQDEMLLVWPVLTESEKQAAAAPTAVPAQTSVQTSALKSQHMLAILAGALAVAGILMALVYRLGSIRFGRRQQQRQSPRWDITTETAARLPLAPPPLAYADPVPRSSAPVRRAVLPRRPPELDRDGRE